MSTIRIDQFRGIVPLAARHLLQNEQAQIAENCLLDTGAVRPLYGLVSVNTPSKAGTKLSIYLWGNYWFHWITDVDCVQGPIPGDTFYRVYWTGDGVPKMSYSPFAVNGGGTGYPTNSYILGLPAPTDTTTVAISGTATSDDPLLAETWAYVVTNVSGMGEEGPNSTPTVAVTRAPGQTATLSSIPVFAAADYDVTHKRIYRRATGSTSTGQWLLVAKIANATTSYADSVNTADLEVVTLASETWDAPPSDLTGLIALPGGSLAGFHGKEWCVSVPYMAHAWPVGYRVATDLPIVSHVAFGTSILVTTTGKPYIITGFDPAAMTVEKAEIGYACVSKRGTVDMGTYAAYPANEGLIIVGTGVAKNATIDVFGLDAWKALNPSSMVAYNYKGKYVCFYNNGSAGAFIFDPTTGNCTTLTGITATAGYSDPLTANLYLQVGTDISQFDANPLAPLTFTWRSKPYRMMAPAQFSCGQVYADAYPVTCKVYADGTLVHTQTVASNRPFRLATGRLRGITWTVEVTGTAAVNSVYLAPSFDALTTGKGAA